MKYILWKNDRISKFVLGTAQLGMNYGIANIRGQPSEKQACEIVKTVWKYGVNCFDTAQAYGNSESILGKALTHCAVDSNVKIISKLSPELKSSDSKSIKQSIETSRQNLGVNNLWCLMLHRADWLDVWDEGLGQLLTDAVNEGIIKYLGVSSYYPDEARRALEHPDIQVIQVPCNIWDQKMLKEGIFELVKKKNKLCFVRSIFLQGLLLLPPEKAAEKLPIAKEASQKWHKLATKFAMRPEQLSIRFGLSIDAPLVIGGEDIQQTEDNNTQLNEQTPLPAKITAEIYNEMLPFLNEHIVNPALWGK
jgi:aryl-alcohol dehydrogenase-like predicted oxidoreductase